MMTRKIAAPANQLGLSACGFFTASKDPQTKQTDIGNMTGDSAAR